MAEITVPAKVDNIPEVTEFVDSILEACDCPMKVQMQIDIAIDEIFSNIAFYAYDNEGDATVVIDTEKEPGVIHLTFIDSGKPYDPLEKEDPDVTLSAEERNIGGLGIFMVKKSMDDMVYEYTDGKNILKLKKTM